MARKNDAPVSRPRSEYAAVMAVVLEAPDDEAPRSVLADWWLERDDPRGELYTQQCRRQKKRPKYGEVSKGLRWRNKRGFSLVGNHLPLIEQHSKQWTEALAGELRSASHGFWRGFIEAGSIDAVDFVPRMDRIFGAEPIRYLRIRA